MSQLTDEARNARAELIEIENELRQKVAGNTPHEGAEIFGRLDALVHKLADAIDRNDAG